MDFTNTDLISLGAKLDALEFTEREHAALRALFTTAVPIEDCEGDVEGYQSSSHAPGVAGAPTDGYGGLIAGLLTLGETQMGVVRPAAGDSYMLGLEG